MKKNIGKRILSLALALVMMAGWMPHMATEAHAAAPITLSDNTFSDPGNGFYFQISALCGAADCDVSVTFNSQSGTTTKSNENHSFTVTSFSYNISAGKATWSYSCSYTTCQGSGTFTYTVSDRAFTCTDKLYIGPSVRTSDKRMYVGVYLCRPRSAHQGDATCVTSANCTLCGTSYKTDHIYNTIPTGNGLKHYHPCMTEDCTAKYEEKTYTQGDHAIIETCNFSGCDRALTITLPEITESYTYTGSEFRPLGNEDVVYSIGGNTIAFDTIPADDRVPVQYENNANAGTAKAYITKGGVRAERPFTINPASIAGATVELQSISEKYTGGDLTPTVAVTYSGTQLTEHTDYEISWHPANVVDVGTYQIKIKGKGNFKDEATLNQTFAITRATPTAANFVLTPPTSLTYDGGEKKATVAVAEGIVGMGSVTAVHYFNSAGAEVETPTAVDTYTVKVDVAEGGNYEAITGLAVGSFTIEKATPTFTDPTAKELTYKGEPLTLVEAGSVNPGKLLYSLDGGEYSETVPTATNAGNYTVYYKVVDLDTDNYNEISSGSVPVTIRKAEAPDITFPEVLNEITYGQKLEEAKLSFYENDYGTFNWNAPTAYPGEAGTISCALDFYPNELALQNYDWKDAGNAQWIASRNALCICPNVTVNKAPSTLTAPTANDLTYDGTPLTLVAAGSTNDGTMVYSLDKEGEYKAELPQAMDVGTYTVWYKVIGDSNHNDSEPDSVTAEIKQRPVTVTANNASKTYGDTDPELTWEVTSGETLASEPLVINISRAAGDNAGDYTITVSQTEGANKNYAITFVNGIFTINKAVLTVTAENKTATYGDAIPTYTVTYDGFAGSENKDVLGGTLAFDCTYAQYADKGTYTITPKGYESGNYDISYVDGTLTVAPKAITVTIDNKTSVYGKEIVELTATDNGIANGDTNVYSLATTATNTSNVAQYAITGTALDGNYDITFANGTYTITKADAAFTAPTPNKLTYDGSEQTLIDAGATNDGTMVYSLEKEGTYTADLPMATTAGKYNVWYKVIGDGNHKDSAPDYIEVEIYKADPGIGTVTAGVVNDTLETSAIVLTRENPTVEGMLTVDAGQTLALGENTIRYTFLPTDTTNYKVVTDDVTVTVKDTIAPTGTVTISTKSWAEFLNDITFGLFFKETQTVSVNASDNLSGVAKIEYIESATALDLDAVKAVQQWTEMKNGSVSVTLEDTKQFIYYIRITDKSGNIAYLSSDGAEYDTTAPVIEGVNNGATYYTTQTVTVTDKNIDTITLNGEAATGTITLEGNKEATYTIVATDKAGNSTTVTVTMKPIRALAEATNDLTNDNVTSANTPALEALVEKLDELLADDDATDGEREALEQHKAIAESLIQTIEDTAAEQKAVTDKAAEFDEDKVKSTDKAELEKLAEDIEALLDTNNLTQDERTVLETLLEQVEGMTDTIGKTAADSKTATDAIDALDPETVKSTDKAAVEEALETIENLLDGDHLTDTERDALKDAKADAEALLDAIEDAAKAANTENTAKVEDVTADNVTPEDKSDLEDAKADLEKALEDNSGNYTEEEKQAIQDEIDRIDEALEVIENVEAVEDAIADLPATVEPDDEETVAEIEDAKKAYDELTEYEKSLVDEDTKKKLDDLTAAAVAYEIVKGDNGKWTKGSTSGLSFTANGPLGKFSGIEIDGKVIDAKYYDAVAGSTVITLKASYLETLSTGKHTITVVYTDGETEGIFKINAKSATPATGDESNIMLYGSMFTMSLAALVVLLLASKKRKQAS